jgi:hypothetical protein
MGSRSRRCAVRSALRLQPARQRRAAQSAASAGQTEKATAQFKQAAAALRTSQSALGAYFRRLCARMDKAKAVTAAAHKLARLFYALLTRGQEYVDQGQQYYEERYRERFSLGLLTGCGSLGLLFPPALPIILYGIVAQVAIEDLFLGGLLPGLLLLALVMAWGVREGLVGGSRRAPFAWRELFASLNEAKWELLMPVLVLVAIFGGFATLVEAAALTALYAFATQTFVHRDLALLDQGDILKQQPGEAFALPLRRRGVAP